MQMCFNLEPMKSGRIFDARIDQKYEAYNALTQRAKYWVNRFGNTSETS